jgi:hypothetical protein
MEKVWLVSGWLQYEGDSYELQVFGSGERARVYEAELLEGGKYDGVEVWSEDVL